MDTLCKKNIHVHRLLSFCENCDDNLQIASHFSQVLCDRGTWNLFCILTNMDTLCKPNFMFLGHTLFEKNAMISCKIQSCTIVPINNFEILQVSIAFFFDPVRPRNLKFILYINPYGYFLQKNFMFLGRTDFEKNAMRNCKNSKLCNWPNKQLWNFTR